MIQQQHSPYLFTPNTVRLNCPLFIFLPGMDGTGRLLAPQTETLQQCFDIRCLVIPPNNDSDWQGLAETVIALIRQEQAHKPVATTYLCGESFGGCLALRVLEQAPELLNRVILVNPASSFRDCPFLGWGSRVIDGIPDLYHSAIALILPFLAAMGRISPYYRRTLFKTMKAIPPKTVVWRLSLLERFVIDSQSLQGVSLPVLLLAAGSDRILPSVKEANRLADYFSVSQVVILPKSGHTCLLETDTQLCQILQQCNFLEDGALKQLST